MSDSRRRWLWVGIAIAIAVLVVVPFAPSPRDLPLDRRLSTLRTTPDGAAAIFDTLDELDIPVARRRHPLAGIDLIDSPIALLSPTEPLTPHEVDAVLAWVSAGGDAILVAWPYTELRTRLGLPGEYVDGGAEGAPHDSLRVALPTAHEWVEGTSPVGPVHWTVVDTSSAKTGKADRPSDRWIPLLVEPTTGDPVALILPHGQGRILVIGDPALLENGQIADAGVMPMLARAAADMTADGDTLFFDEYHHGHSGGRVSAAVWGFLTGTGAGRVVLQLFAVAALTLLPLMIRFGAPRDEPPPARRSPLEHVAALGAVYREAGADAIARRRLLQGFARRIGREHVPIGGEHAFLRRLEQRVPVGANAVSELAACWSDPKCDLIELTRRMERAVETLRK